MSWKEMRELCDTKPWAWRIWTWLWVSGRTLPGLERGGQVMADAALAPYQPKPVR